MKFSHLVAFLPFFLCSFSSASVISSPELAKRAENNITGPYYLKTKVLHGGDPAKDGLYVWAYHTGAGLNDAVLGQKASARPSYLNNTYQTFNLSTDFPWSFYLPSDINYAGWEFVYINAGMATSGLWYNESGLQWLQDQSFGGWLACDWWHGLPQLFWKVNYAPYNYSVPTCAQVELKMEPVGED